MTVEDRYEEFERQIRANFAQFNQLVTARLAQHISADGLVNYAAMQTDYRRLAQQFAAELVNVMILGANISAKEAAEQTAEPLTFNPSSPEAAATFTELNNRVIGLLMAQQAEALVEMQRIAAQVEPIRSMKVIRQGLTLTGRQVKAVDNFRRMLEEGSSEALTRRLRDRRFDPTLRRAIAGKLTLTTDQIDRMVERYTQRQIDFRARTIAATEAVRIANESDNLFWRQAVASGDVEEEQVERKWITSKDEKVRPSHVFAGDQPAIGLNELFLTGDGNRLRFPGDPRAPAADTINCRCWVRTKVKEISELDQDQQTVAA